MGFGKAFGKIFMEQADEDETNTEVDESTETEGTSEKAKGSVVATPETKAEAPALNSNIVESIKNAIDEANLDGYDYYEFMQAISEQKDLPSEKKKYEMVFSVIKGMGVTKEHLTTTADHYITVIGKHNAEFDSIIESEEQTKVVKLNNKADSMEEFITTKTEQIEALKAEIQTLSTEKAEVLKVATANEAELATLKQEGVVAYKLFTNQISDGKTKINQYIS